MQSLQTEVTDDSKRPLFCLAACEPAVSAGEVTRQYYCDFFVTDQGSRSCQFAIGVR